MNTLCLLSSSPHPSSVLLPLPLPHPFSPLNPKISYAINVALLFKFSKHRESLCLGRQNPHRGQDLHDCWLHLLLIPSNSPRFQNCCLHSAAVVQRHQDCRLWVHLCMRLSLCPILVDLHMFQLSFRYLLILTAYKKEWRLSLDSFLKYASFLHAGS